MLLFCKVAIINSNAIVLPTPPVLGEQSYVHAITGFSPLANFQKSLIFIAMLYVIVYTMFHFHFQMRCRWIQMRVQSLIFHIIAVDVK